MVTRFYTCLNRYSDDSINPTDTPEITVFRDGHGVSRTSDLIIYSVEAESINKVVAQFGPCKQCRHPL